MLCLGHWICAVSLSFDVMLHKFSLIVHCIIFNTTTATAKSLQSCPTLCDPIDGSPPGSPVPGILQERVLEWVAISFSNAWKWKWKWSRSVVSDPQRPHGLQPTRLLHPWDFPGKNTAVGCHLTPLLEHFPKLLNLCYIINRLSKMGPHCFNQSWFCTLLELSLSTFFSSSLWPTGMEAPYLHLIPSKMCLNYSLPSQSLFSDIQINAKPFLLFVFIQIPRGHEGLFFFLVFNEMISISI